MLRTFLLACAVALSILAQVSAQVVERTPGTEEVKFTAAVRGEWSVEELVAAGRSSPTTNYGPILFTDNTWTISTRGGDHVYTISAVQEEGGVAEITFESRIDKRSLIALAKLDGNKLIVARSIRWNGNSLPRPHGISPGKDTLLYTFVRKGAGESARSVVQLRVIEGRESPRELLACSIRSTFNGNVRYPETPRRRDDSGNIASSGELQLQGEADVNGTVHYVDETTSRVVLTIRLPSVVEKSDGDLEVASMETIQIRGTLTVGDGKRIALGSGRHCELVLEKASQE